MPTCSVGSHIVRCIGHRRSPSQWPEHQRTQAPKQMTKRIVHRSDEPRRMASLLRCFTQQPIGSARRIAVQARRPRQVYCPAQPCSGFHICGQPPLRGRKCEDGSALPEGADTRKEQECLLSQRGQSTEGFAWLLSKHCYSLRWHFRPRSGGTANVSTWDQCIVCICIAHDARSSFPTGQPPFLSVLRAFARAFILDMG